MKNNDESVIFSATDSENEVKTVDSPAELVQVLEDRGELP